MGGSDAEPRLNRPPTAAERAAPRPTATVARSRGYARLLEACARTGCPVCRCVRDDAVRYLHGLLDEHVTDPAVRTALRASRGFCGAHALMLVELPDSAFGAAIIGADLLAREVARVEAIRDALGAGRGRWRSLLGRRRGGPRSPDAAPAPCPACAAMRDAEQRHLGTLAESAGDGRFDRAFDRSDGLCRPHVEQLVGGDAPAPALARLLARAVERWRVHLERLRAFADKHDHANRVPISDAEARSWPLVIELLAGPPGGAPDAPSRGGAPRGRRG